MIDYLLPLLPLFIFIFIVNLGLQNDAPYKLVYLLLGSKHKDSVFEIVCLAFPPSV